MTFAIRLLTVLVVLWLGSPVHAQTLIFSSGWETGSGTASNCTLNSANVLLDGYPSGWADYGPGGSQICDATPDLASISTSPVHSGSRALQMHFKDGDGNNGPDVRIVKTFGQNYSDLYIRFYIRWSSDFVWADADHKMVILGTGNQSSQDVYFNMRGNGGDGTTARFRLYNTTDDTFWAAASGVGASMTVDTWYRIEGHIVSGASGSVAVRINGTDISSWTREAGSGPSTPTGISNVDTVGYIKLDDTYNCFRFSPPSTGCTAENSFEFLNTTGQADVFYDDVCVQTGGWCGATAGEGGNQTRVPFIRR